MKTKIMMIVLCISAGLFAQSKDKGSAQKETQDGILFIMSNAKTYGDSEIETGTSFSEIIHAYDVFVKHGFQVDFLTPIGGAIHLGHYYNPKDSLQYSYFNNKKFMQQLQNTKTPNEINVADYKAVYYVGGGAAMYQVPENKQIQNISMSIYKQDGVISSVCHGTAGIVNLKTDDGKYLVNGKKVNGFPDAFEKKEKAYYQEFPFSIEQKVNNHGGHFSYSADGWDGYAIADGRLITGQDPSASAKVAELVITALQKLN